MSYYLAPALDVLRSEINARWPGRDRTSDGWIGDLAHQGTKSDHNPNSRGSVNAIDVDEDGIDWPVLFAAIRRHPSARYVIYERRLYHRLRGWRSEPYSGVNPHDHHAHLSIDQTEVAEQDRRPWGLLEDIVTPAEITAAVLEALQTPVRLPGKPGDRLEAAGWRRDMSPLAVMAYGMEHFAAGVPTMDPAEIVAGVLAGLSPETLAEQIAAHLPDDQAQRVVDELAARLARPAT